MMSNISPKELTEIIENVPLAIVSELKSTNSLGNKLTFKGATLFNNGKYYVALASECDAMTHTLVREALTITHPNLPHSMVYRMVEPYWSFDEVKKAAQKRVVETLGNYE